MIFEPIISFINIKIGNKIKNLFLRKSYNFNISSAENDFDYSPMYIEQWIKDLSKKYKKKNIV